MIEEKIKEEIAELKKQEEKIRTKRQRLESQLFEITAKKIKKQKEATAT